MPGGGRGPQHFDCWGWSNDSLEAARKAAREKAERVAQHLRMTQRPPDRYSYGTRPLREQVLRSMPRTDGSLAAAITRNQYGCLVLNTAGAMFVDIDIPELEPPPSRGFLFFRKPKPVPEEEIVRPHLQRVEHWSAARPDWSWRIYRTRAGLRLLATHALVDPGTAEPIFKALGTDPLYQKLCANQKSFRARLTPKPWRIDHHIASVKWPWPNEKVEASFNRWEKTYLEKSANFATCRFLKAIGPATVHPEISPLIELHDQSTKAHASLNLA